MRSLLAIIAMMPCVVFAVAACTPKPQENLLEEKAAWAVGEFSASVMTQEELRRQLAESEADILLVDARSAEEFAVSRLPGARHWNPYETETPPDAVREHAEQGKPVVFYCSIGYRSGYAAERARKQIGKEAPLFNLSGGIFQWASEGGPLEGGDRVHPYDEEWGRLLDESLHAPLDAPE